MTVLYPTYESIYQTSLFSDRYSSDGYSGWFTPARFSIPNMQWYSAAFDLTSSYNLGPVTGQLFKYYVPPGTVWGMSTYSRMSVTGRLGQPPTSFGTSRRGLMIIDLSTDGIYYQTPSYDTLYRNNICWRNELPFYLLVRCVCVFD
jgi:hypothetical protein